MEGDITPAEPASHDWRWFLLQQKIQELRVVGAFQLFRTNGIEPILIKGLAAVLNYPQDIPRVFTDTDLAVSSSDFPRAKQILKSGEGIGLVVDLHNEIRHLDTVDWEDIFANSRLIDIDGIKVRVLGPEDHLRVMSTHWLTDGGAYRHRLWDIYYAVKNRPADFDWDRCLGIVSATRRNWILLTIGLAHKHLGLEIDDLPFADEARQIPPWVDRCLEREWKSDVRLEPVIAYLNNPKQLFRQIVKRIPPNPIRATVEMEARFDDRSRVWYQIQSFLRLLPSVSALRLAHLRRPTA